MKEIIALQEYTDKFISLYEGEIRNIEDKLANQLISKNIVAEHTDDESSQKEGNFFIVDFNIDGNNITSNKTYSEIKNAFDNNKIIIARIIILIIPHSSNSPKGYKYDFMTFNPSSGGRFQTTTPSIDYTDEHEQKGYLSISKIYYTPDLLYFEFESYYLDKR